MMKKYLNYIIALCIILGNMQVALAQADKPTIKIGVFYTPAAVSQSSGQPMNNYIDTSLGTLKTLMVNNDLSTIYDVDVTAKTLLQAYVEPKHRPGPNQYLSIIGNGTDQAFSEIMLHDDFATYYESSEDNDDDIPGTLDDDLNTNVLDENEVDNFFVDLQRNVQPDVIFVIVDETGDPMVVDGAIKDAQAGYDDPLFVVLSANYFFSDSEALAYGFFRLFCDYGYSDADLGSDDPGVYSFLSDYWTGVEGTDLLSETNVELFKYNVGKLKLANDNSGQIVFDGSSDLTFQYAQTVQDVNSATAIVFDGSNQDFAIAIPAATLANESNSSSDIYGDEVKIANSFMAFTSGEYTLDPTQETDPRSDNTPSTTPYTPPSFSLPIDFDNDIIADKKNQYISNYFGANASVTDGTTTNKDFLTITKFKGASNACAETIIQNISGLTLSTSSKKLQIDVKLGTNASATDELVMILHADDGSRLLGKIENSGETDLNRKKQLTGATSTGYKTFDVVFNPTGTKTYSSISLRFNNCETGSNDKSYYVDNIKRGVTPSLIVSGSVNFIRPLIEVNGSKTIQVTVNVKNDATQDANNVKIKVDLPGNSHYSSISGVNAPNETTFNTTTSIWEIKNLPAKSGNNSNNEKTLNFKVDVKYKSTAFKENGDLKSPSPYHIDLSIDQPENSGEPSEIKVYPVLKGADLMVRIRKWGSNGVVVHLINNDGNNSITNVKGVLKYGSNWEYKGGANVFSKDCSNCIGYIARKKAGRIVDVEAINIFKNGSSSANQRNDYSWELPFDKTGTSTDAAADKFEFIANGESGSSMGKVNNKTNNDPLIQNNSASLRLTEDELADLEITSFQFENSCLSPGSEGKIIVKVRNKSTDVIAKNVKVKHLLSSNHIKVKSSTPVGVFTKSPLIDLPDGTKGFGFGNIDFGDIPKNTIKTVTLNIELLSIYDMPDDYLIGVVTSDNESYEPNNYTYGFDNEYPNINVSGAPSAPVECSDAHTINWTLKLENKGTCDSENVKVKIDLPSAATSITTDQGSSWVRQGSYGTWTVGNLTTTESRSIKITYGFNSCQTSTHNYEITSDNHKKLKSIYKFNTTGGRAVPSSEVALNNVEPLIKTTTPIKVYPNPFSGLFKIVFEQGEVNTEYVVARVFDLSGRVVLQQRFETSASSAQDFEIDGSQLPNGPYIIELNNGSGNVQRSKLIKK